jgi:hypothetical protein
MMPTTTLNMHSKPFTQACVHDTQPEEEERAEDEKQITHPINPLSIQSGILGRATGQSRPFRAEGLRKG